MTLNSKIHYLHYIICFIDYQCKIFDTLDETFCNASIRDLYDDSYLKKEGQSYQFTLCDDNCYIQVLEANNSFLIEEKKWMNFFCINYLKYIENFDKQKLRKFIIHDNSEGRNHKIFFVREINIKMKQELFEKIICNPFDCKKQYTSEDLFYICYSYAFSILDNRIYILKNILFLITQDSLDLDEINQVFLRFVSQKIQNSPLLEKFQNVQCTSESNDLQSKIDQFLLDSHGLETKDQFLFHLHQWKSAVSNMFMLIRQSFCFYIMTKNNDLILKICNNRNTKSIFEIQIEDIDKFMTLINADCIFLFESFSSEGNNLMSRISMVNKMEKITIDITGFFKKICTYFKEDLPEPGAMFHDCMKFIAITIAKPVFINIGIYRFKLKTNPRTDFYSFINLHRKFHAYFDINFFICERIFDSHINALPSALKIIIQQILHTFKKNDDLENITIDFLNDPLDILQNSIISDSNIHIEPSYDFINFLNSPEYIKFQSNAFNMEMFCQNSKLLEVFECPFSQIHNQDYMEGVIDENFFLYIRKLSKLKLISRIKDQLNNEIHKYKDTFNQNTECFDLLNIPCNKNQIAIHLQNSSKLNRICNQHINLPGFASENSSSNYAKEKYTDKRIKIYHYEKPYIQFLKSYHTQHLNSQKFLITRINSSLQEFQICKSNFHFILDRLLELKSTDSELSTITKETKNSESHIEICHCFVTFLPNSYFIMKNLYLRNCELLSELAINSNIFSRPSHTFTIENSNLSNLDVFDFVSISSFEQKNKVIIEKKQLFLNIILRNCNVDFFSDVPIHISSIQLDKCKITVKNNNMYFEKTVIEKEIENIVFSSTITHGLSHLIHNEHKINLSISHCILPENLQLHGFADSFQFQNCIGSFFIHNSTKSLKISNHLGEFCIENLIHRACSIDKKNSIIIDEQSIHIINFKLHTLQNIRIDNLLLKNCSIQKIANIECKSIEIQNTECAFKLKNNEQVSNFHNISLNMKISQDTYMHLDKYSTNE